MVRAHQAAYGFLNPNITKYETLLGLLDQATQTQLSLQPIMAALVLYFEEINQALEEMAEEGELMLKEYGESMSLPSGMVSQALWSDKPSNTLADLLDPPPDLLQQLLQQSSEKMKRVGGSVKNLGDTALDEVIEYFSCLSKLFAEKLQTKQAAELRLSQVLARIEMSAIKTSNPKDSALPSEDSGIGGESESLAGSERHQCHRGYSKGEDTGNASRSCTDCRDDLEIDNLPPPPPEVLLDNSFNPLEVQCFPENVERYSGAGFAQEEETTQLLALSQNRGLG
ncbi:PREDICTED: uncharacterized protein C2orf71-like [Cyprinodon variegatus]|uniref:uncharacterized protein C2orf71-like n=1 Tax=Cyprinodon variegatus TaxID=28743 RepID=UPI0007429DA7|nr:PREDICTED: uncharacterized protein C2orf71-like [Cyprinodon variegatus]